MTQQTHNNISIGFSGRPTWRTRSRKLMRYGYPQLPISDEEWLIGVRKRIETRMVDRLGEPIKRLRIIRPLPQLLYAANKRENYRYFKVQKAACSSVVQALLQATGRAEDHFSNLSSADQALNFFGKIRHAGREEFVALNKSGLRVNWGVFFPFTRFAPEPRADIRFCIVRDPVARFVSGYYNILHVQRHYDRIYDVDTFLDKLENSWVHADKETSPEKELFAQDRHFRPQYYSLGEDPKYYTHIFNMNNMHKFEKLLSELAGKRIPMDILNASPKEEKPILTKTQQRRVQALYSKDYELFGSYFETA